MNLGELAKDLLKLSQTLFEYTDPEYFSEKEFLEKLEKDGELINLFHKLNEIECYLWMKYKI